MGVKGLTSFVYKKSDVYFENFQLKNTLLVIDGYALAAILYNSSSINSNSAFGGDYDRYANIVLKFFNLLEKCHITPIVVCDGGYEKKKVNTIKKRILCKIFSLERITPSHSNVQCFPLMIRHVFREVLLKKKVDVVQCDFEADSEIAALARKFDAPVLSNDSDFFIFDVLYIPLSSFEFNTCEKDDLGHFFIPCEIFNIDNLLNGFGGMNKSLLPLLATLLGNDYVKASQFKKFYNLLKMDKNKNTSTCEKRVKAVVSWLKRENFESALNKILGSLGNKQRRVVRRNIKAVINGYTNLNTPLESFLSNDIKSKIKNEPITELGEEFSNLVLNDDSSSECDEDVVNEMDDPAAEDNNEVNNSEDSQSSGSIEEEEDLEISSENEGVLPDWLLNESRKANLYPSINTLVSLRAYFYEPQVENYTFTHAGSITLPILQTIMACLGIDSITYWSRIRKSYRGTQLSSISQEENFCEKCLKNQLTVMQKEKIIYETFEVKDSLCIKSIPCEWQLYIMSIIYWIKSATEALVKPYHIHAIIITLIIVGVICPKVGIFWKKSVFTKKYGARLKALSNRTVVEPKLSGTSIDEIINAVSVDDCIMAMDSLTHYFESDTNLKRRPQEFSRNTMHLLAQLQYTFVFAVTLNSLLLMPFKRSDLSMFYNGTFIYNIADKFRTCSNIIGYIENLFSKQPIFIYLYKSIYDKLCILSCEVMPKQKFKIKKSKPRKKPIAIEIIKRDVGSTDDEETFDDANNKYSILNRVAKIC